VTLRCSRCAPRSGDPPPAPSPFAMSWTFKDDGSSLTYYREYNKEVGTGDKTLVGNWVEERALRDAVATGRYKLWVNSTEDAKAPQQTFTKFTTRPDTLDTYRRTVVHSDHTPATEFITSNQVPDPGYAVYVPPGKATREQLREARARELAANVAPAAAAELPPQYLSTYGQHFTSKDLPAAETLGRRVMMTQNMEDIKGSGDGLWRKESNLVSRHLVPETDGVSDPSFLSKSYGKDATFSTPIAEYQKGEEKD